MSLFLGVIGILGVLFLLLANGLKSRQSASKKFKLFVEWIDQAGLLFIGFLVLNLILMGDFSYKDWKFWFLGLCMLILIICGSWGLYRLIDDQVQGSQKQIFHVKRAVRESHINLQATTYRLETVEGINLRVDRSQYQTVKNVFLWLEGENFSLYKSELAYLIDYYPKTKLVITMTLVQ
ncbi:MULTISPECIES: hypothetical protein [Aerococcus]|uniref:hypothetical protein n=1 Tax=Aerococcus urinae (strain CCUG 59500 / ACS-120-V-Col10a) TaxID=2976812 RepID=UPI000200F3DC|nr:hypothetical protein [Aerococcus sp. Group 1]AEA01707.1 hypothetical protein HMPREF9243_1934 [Aerococcus sp. Group 1]MCY3055432.1 hypothetical protein [Aerococcus sp. Group 1]MCY3057162.1 hypothetical protein [Aerococcus sp. Group 1]MCY3061524.1 hypothetical protein [Aerococcus sp. Group 1]